MARSELRPIDQFIADAAAGTMTRREPCCGRRAGLSASAIGMALRATPEAAFAQAAEPAGQIVISLSAEPATLENWNAYSLDGHPSRNIFEALLNRDPATNELVGELATAWEWTDDRTLRFTLREGVTFHDGSHSTRRSRPTVSTSPGLRRTPSTSRSSWDRRSARRSSTR